MGQSLDDDEEEDSNVSKMFLLNGGFILRKLIKGGHMITSMGH